MNNTNNYIITKYSLDANAKSPLLIPHVSRDDLAGLFHELGFKSGAEIGVEKGKFSEVLCRANPGVKLYCIDPWLQYSEYRDTLNNVDLLNKYYEETKNRLSNYNCELIRKYSIDAVKDFKPESLDFVYIDGNHHFDYVAEDIIHWSKIVRPGGIVSGHDYREDNNEKVPFHVIAATHAYAEAHKITPWFVLPRSSTWFWVKT